MLVLSRCLNKLCGPLELEHLGYHVLVRAELLLGYDFLRLLLPLQFSPIHVRQFQLLLRAVPIQEASCFGVPQHGHVLNCKLPLLELSQLLSVIAQG